MLLYAGVVLLSAALILIAPQNLIGWRLADGCFFVLSAALFSVVHLLAQMGVGSLLGLRPDSAAIGCGVSLYHIEIGVLGLDLKPFPAGSALKLIGTNERYYRTRQFITMLAGPLCTLALFVLCMKMFGYKSQRELDAFIGLNWDAYLSRAVLVVLVLNLWPRKIHLMDRGELMTDGMRLARLPFLSRKNVMEEIRHAYMVISSTMLTRGRIGEAEELCHQGLEKVPDDFWLRYRLLGVYGDRGEFERHREVGARLLEESKAGSWGQLYVQCDLAYYAFLFQRHEYLEEAEAASASMYGNVSWYPYVISTRGLVLAWQGRTAEGERLLKQGVELQCSWAMKSDLLCVLAALEQGRGNPEVAGRYMEQARKLSPHSVFLRRLQERTFEPFGAREIAGS